MAVRLENIGKLWGVGQPPSGRIAGLEMANLASLENAWLRIQDDRIVSYGLMREPDADTKAEVFDMAGKWIFPSFCDSHTHLVYASSREQELNMKLDGLGYEEIAARGGGILNSARKLQGMSEDDLFAAALPRLMAMEQMGVGAVEIKSGYGLTAADELKMLRVIQRLKAHTGMLVKATFLALHAVPEAYKHQKDAFVELMVGEVLPVVAAEKLADFVDLFCERNYFDLHDMERLLVAAKAVGLKAKVHVNQFSSMGGVALAVQHGALSIDHLEVMEDADFEALDGADIIPTLLPGCSFYLGIPFGPARALMQRNLPLAIASDYNPGSAPSFDPEMNLVLAVLRMRMKPEEALNAMTINAAAAMELENEVGSISTGKKAHFFVTNAMPSLTYFPYAFGERKIREVWLNGRPID